MELNEITGIIVDCFYKVHTILGPGLFESVYEEALCYEISKRGLRFVRQVPVDVMYENIKLKVAFVADIIVEGKVIIEIKSIEKLANIHKKQLHTYLKLTGIKVGLLVNFNEVLIKDGIVRIANNA